MSQEFDDYYFDESDEFIDEDFDCGMGLIPRIRGLLSYSDPSIGHEGTIYEADMWCPLGLTDECWGYGWKSRGGRRDQRVSRKMRWFRTP